MHFKNNLLLQLNLLCGLRAYTYLNDVIVDNIERKVFPKFPLAYPPISPLQSLNLPPGLGHSEAGVGSGEAVGVALWLLKYIIY